VAFSPDNSMLAFGGGRTEGGEITLMRVPIREKLQTMSSDGELNSSPEYWSAIVPANN
jgi:hypothetical protein